MAGYFRSCNEQRNRVPLTVPWTAPVQWLSWLAVCAKEQSAKVAAWQHTTIWNAKAAALWNMNSLWLSKWMTDEPSSPRYITVSEWFSARPWSIGHPAVGNSAKCSSKSQHVQQKISGISVCKFLTGEWRSCSGKQSDETFVADDMFLPWASRVENCCLIRSPRFLSVQNHTRKMVRWFRGCSPVRLLNLPTPFCCFLLLSIAAIVLYRTGSVRCGSGNWCVNGNRRREEIDSP